MRLVRRNEENFTCCDGESAPINFDPAFSFGANDQNGFIKPVRPPDPMQMGFGIPSEAFDMQTDTERMAADMAEHIGGQVMDDLAREPLCLGFHGR
jgi:hypothetical protein